jgi:hypothetical protein
MEGWFWLIAIIAMCLLGGGLMYFIPKASLGDDCPTDPDSSSSDRGHPFIF